MLSRNWDDASEQLGYSIKAFMKAVGGLARGKKWYQFWK